MKQSANNRKTVGNKPAPQRQSSSKTVAKKPLSKYWMLPLVIAIAIIPLITVVHSYDCGLEENAWFSSGGLVYDFFLYYKAFFLRLIGVVVLFLLAYLVPFRDHGFLKVKRNLPPIIAIGIFGLVSLASAIVSDHKGESFFGGFEQFEGWFVLLTYVACFFLAFGFARTIELIRFLLDALLIGATIIGVLGFFQAIGFDWIQSGWAKPLLGAEVNISGFDIKLNFGDGVSYATLYNPNYVGSYVALVLPYCLYLILRGEKLWRRVLSSVTSITLVVTLFASGSKTGIIGLVIAAFVCALLVFPYMKKWMRVSFIAAIVVAVGCVSVLLVSRGHISNLFSAGEDIYVVDDVTCEKDAVHVYLDDGKVIKLTLDEEKMKADSQWAGNNSLTDMLTVTDDNGNPLATTVNEMNYVVMTEEGYAPLVFCPELREIPDEQGNITGYLSLLHVYDVYGYNWNFAYTENGMQIYNDFSRYDSPRLIEKSGFESNYWFASRRGYIWSRTIPMLADHLFVGAGPDSFIYSFPNDDYVGKEYVDYGPQTITKPHDLFLQTWMQDGLPSLLALLFLYLLLVIRAFRLCYGKNKVEADSGISFHSFAIISAVAATGYMIVGIANDSTITVAPIYWVMLGAGYAAESMCRVEKQA